MVIGPRRPTLAVLRALACWLALAIVASTEGLTERLLTPLLLPFLILFLTLMVLTVAATSAWLRNWLSALDVRTLVLVHVARFVPGLWLLVLSSRGALPYAFAVPGAIGEILVAALAVGVVAVTDARASRGRGLLIAWSVLGFVAILMAMPAMAALVRFPLSLLPTFLVPLMITTHVIVLARVWRTSEGASTAPSGSSAQRTR